MASPRNRLFFAIQASLKYVPFAWGATLRRCLYRPFFASVGRGLTVHDNVTIKYPDEIRLGHHVTINTGCFVVGLGGLSMGDDVMLGAGTKIVTTAHGRSTDLPMQRQRLETRPIVIEDDVWLGFDVKVLPGAVIRKGAVLGAGSVVTSEIPAFAIAAGIPAKVIGSRV
jgi:acetyltransferase-like isoleucine patch superfamily enzyme